MEWELHKIIGSGSYGNVYLVKNVKSGEYAALKTSGCFEGQNIVQGTLRELFFYSTFSPSPGVCSSLGHWKKGDKAFFLLPLFPCTLETVYTNFHKCLPFNDFLRIFSQIASGLDAMHKQGFLHRDIKPENVLISPSGACLADFNLMRWAGVEQELTLETKWENIYANSTEARAPQNFTRQLKENASTYICTLWTRAPELVLANLNKKDRVSYGAEIDIFSLGCTMLALGAGDFVLGKQCSLPKEETEDEIKKTTEYRYLGGFFKFFGIDEEIAEIYKGYSSEQSWSNASAVIYSYLKNQILWNTEQLLSVSKLLAGMLHPIPSHRSKMSTIRKWLSKHEVTPLLSESLSGFLARKQDKLVKAKLSPIVIRIDQYTPAIPVQHDFDPLQFWGLCSQHFIPPYISCEVLRLKRATMLSLQYSKALLYLLDSVHDFQKSENFKLFSGIDPEHVYALACVLKPQYSTLQVSLSLLGSPFLVCCLAAEIYVTGSCASAEELKKSKTMYLSNVKPFFEAYGNSWKSQLSMRQIWSRL
jgi:serine/threonine protein kinase